VNRFYAVRFLHAAVFYKDREIRTQQRAQSAIDAVSIVDEFRRMVTFRIGVLGHDERILGAKLNAKSAPFASFLDDVNDAARNLDAVPVQGLSPIGHVPSSIPH
jgi:hypothetical protein